MTREEKAAEFMKQSGRIVHSSDCATSIAPAEEPGLCDCASSPCGKVSELDEKFRCSRPIHDDNNHDYRRDGQKSLDDLMVEYCETRVITRTGKVEALHFAQFVRQRAEGDTRELKAAARKFLKEVSTYADSDTLSDKALMIAADEFGRLLSEHPKE